MCREAHEIKELKLVQERDGDGVAWKYYLFDKGDYYAFYDDVRLNDSEYLRSENTSSYNLTWLPTFEQYLKIYSEKNNLDQESLSLLWLANYIEDQVKEDHGFCLFTDTKEKIALMWVMEKCFGKRWHGDKTWINLKNSIVG